jgi:hypothetical protein
MSLNVWLNDANQHLTTLGSFHSAYILPYIKRRSPQTVIAAAVAAFFSYQVYKMVHVPRNLRHIPAVPYWRYMRSALSGEGIDVRTHEIILPVVTKSPNGLYLRPNRFGWCVGVAGPSAMKTVLLRKGKSISQNAMILTNTCAYIC